MRYLLLATLALAPRPASANCETEQTAAKATRFALEREPDTRRRSRFDAQRCCACGRQMLARQSTKAGEVTGGRP